MTTKTVAKRIRRPNITEEQYTKILNHLFMRWTQAEGQLLISIKTVSESMEMVWPPKEQRPLWSDTIDTIKRRFKTYLKTAPKPPKKATRVVEDLSAARATLTKPLSLDLQITSLLRSELQLSEGRQQRHILDQVGSLLSAHENRIERLLDQQYKKLVKFWNDEPDTPEQKLEAVAEEIIKIKAKRVLIAALHENQHALVQQHLVKLMETDDLAGLRVTVLQQDQSLKGYNPDAFDHVILMKRALGHIYMEAITHKFGRGKCKMIEGRGPLSAATAARDWYMAELEKAV